MLPFACNSVIADITFPSVPEPKTSALLAILFQLEQTQWWDAEALAGRQLQQLRRVVDHARRTVPFYRDRLGGVPSAFDDDAWRGVPILRRDEVQAAGDDLLSTDVPADHGGLSEIFTSGTTGRPIRAVRTQLWEMFWSAFTIRDHLWHRRDLAGKLAGIRQSGRGKAPYPEGARASHWGSASSRVFATGPTVSLNITTPIEQQVEWLARESPDYLLTHPSVAHRLAEHCLETGIKLPNLKQVETISEVLRPATREVCRRAWGVPVVDMYTAREAGYIALQCPEAEHYHVQAEGIRVEVLDDAGRPCAPGVIGRVVVTPLHNFAMPLIRYEIGDDAEVGEPCRCGRGLPVLRRILGRRQNMLVMPDGRERWPLLSSADIEAMLAIAPIRRYQFVQRRRDAIELRLVAGRALDAGEEDRLRRWVQEKFGYPFAVAITCHNDLPAGPSGKFDDFVRAIPEV